MALGSLGRRRAMAATACGWICGRTVLRMLRSSIPGSG